jgi:hypothetical protein
VRKDQRIKRHPDEELRVELVEDFEHAGAFEVGVAGWRSVVLYRGPMTRLGASFILLTVGGPLSS